jgi:hypothetical protein
MTNEQLLREIEALKQENSKLRNMINTGWNEEQETFEWKHLCQIVSDHNNEQFTTKLRSRISYCMHHANFKREFIKLKRELERIPESNRGSVLNYICHKSVQTPMEEVLAEYNVVNSDYCNKATRIVDLLLQIGAMPTQHAMQLACKHNVYGVVVLLLHYGATIDENCVCTGELKRLRELVGSEA